MDSVFAGSLELQATNKAIEAKTKTFFIIVDFYLVNNDPNKWNGMDLQRVRKK
jgi:hypothetical protein